MMYLLITWLVSPFLWLRIFLKRNRPIKKILAIQAAGIGDFVVVAPLFGGLQESLPEASIDVLVHPLSLPLAQGMPSIRRAISLPEKGFKGFSSKIWLVKLLSQNYDAVLIFSPNLATTFLPLWAGVPRRVSVWPDRRLGLLRFARCFLSHAEAPVAGRVFRDTARHTVLALIESLGLRQSSGGGVDSGDDFSACSEESASLAANLGEAVCTRPSEIAQPVSGGIKREALLQGKPRPYLGIGIGAGNPLKSLSDTQLDALIAGLLAETGATLVLIGSDKEVSAAARLVSHFNSPRIVDSAGKFSLAELPSLLAGLSGFVGVDSGATYLADALGVPVIDYMGPIDADGQRPMGKQAIIIRSTVSCAPCSHNFDTQFSCHLGTRQCIAEFPVVDVIKRTKELLVK